MKETSNFVQLFVQRVAVILTVIVGIGLAVWAKSYSQHTWNDGITIFFKNTLFIIGLAWALLGIFFLFKRKYINIMLVCASVSFCYILVEMMFFLLITLGIMTPRISIEDSSFGLFNRPCAKCDSISGYKWENQECRIIKLVNGEIEFDVKFHPNQQGYLSRQNYIEKKADSSILRFMVFGDSYTAAEFLNMPWPDYLQERLNVLAPQKFEIYSFAIDGGGLTNWHRTFFKEIIPNYEFDGIILAIWGNDLDRPFAMMHHNKEGAYFGYFDTIPENICHFKKDFFASNKISDIISDSILNIKIKHITDSRMQIKVDLHALMKIYDAISDLKYLKKKKNFDSKFIASKKRLLKDYNINDFISKYGNKNFNRLEEMIRYCTTNNKLVIFTSLADKAGIEYLKNGKIHWTQVELEFLSKYYHVDYFDGLKPFVDLDAKYLNKCYFKYDPHWNQQGSNLFGEKISQFLANKYGE